VEQVGLAMSKRLVAVNGWRWEVLESREHRRAMKSGLPSISTVLPENF
jgi:hypothetical protein